MTGPVTALVANGWTVYAHPAFLDQFEELVSQVDSLKERNPDTWEMKNAPKRLAAVIRLFEVVIPADPTAKHFRLGETLGNTNAVWFRAKFFQQHRLFFLFHSAKKVIVLGWVNDTESIRAYGRKTDAYRTFKKLLTSGSIPDDFDELLDQAKASTIRFMNSRRRAP